MLWLDQIIAGRFKTEIVPLCMTSGNGEEFKGQGFLEWNRDSGIRVDAITDGGNVLLESLGCVPCSPGQLIPNEHYLRLCGKTRSGEEITIERVMRDGCEITMGHPTVVWKIGPDDVLSSVVIAEAGRCNLQPPHTQMLLKSVSLPWPRSSDTIYTNPHFGTTSADYDWLEFPFLGGLVAARRLSDGRVVARADCPGKRRPKLSLAIEFGFGFVTGRKILVEAQEVYEDKCITRTLFIPRGRETTRNFSSPLLDNPMLRTSCEPMLARAAEFFCTDLGEKAGNLLHMCHMSLDSTFTTRALVVCVVLESLVGLMAPGPSSQKSLSDEQKTNLLAHAEQIGIDQRSADRIRGFLDKMDHVSPTNCLRNWAAKNVLGIETADVHAWEQLRHRAAHGKLLMDDDNRAKMQRHLDSLARVTNLVNKLLLNAMHYEGIYHDCARYEMKKFVSVSLP